MPSNSSKGVSGVSQSSIRLLRNDVGFRWRNVVGDLDWVVKYFHFCQHQAIPKRPTWLSCFIETYGMIKVSAQICKDFVYWYFKCSNLHLKM